MPNDNDQIDVQHGYESKQSVNQTIYMELLRAADRAVEEIKDLLRLLETAKSALQTSEPTRATHGNARRPHWDEIHRQLRLGRRLLKEFRQPAPNQTAVLAAFQARGWHEGRVIDPIPKEDGESTSDAQQRLSETIKNLNRGLPSGTIIFKGDGTGRGVSWRLEGARHRSNSKPTRTTDAEPRPNS